MLPQADHLPAVSSETPEVPAVPGPVGCDLVPPLRTKLVLPQREPPPVPEIPIDEDGKAESSEHDVRSARKILGVSREAEAEQSQSPDHDPLGRGVLPLDPGHDGTSRLGTHDVPSVGPRHRSVLADVVILAIELIWRSGYDYADICRAVEAKLTENKARAWPPVTTDGVIEHMKTPGVS